MPITILVDTKRLRVSPLDDELRRSLIAEILESSGRHTAAVSVVTSKYRYRLRYARMSRPSRAKVPGARVIEWTWDSVAARTGLSSP